MKQNWGKTLKIFLAIAGAAIIAIFATSVFEYYQVRNSHQTIAAPVFSLVPTKDIKLGDTVLASTNLKCPWNRHPVNASATPGKGSQAIDNPVIRISRIGWGYCLWDISVKIQPFVNGKIEDGKISIELNPPRPGDEQKEIAAPIPSFEAAAIDIGKSPELATAGSISKKALSSKFLIVSALIIFLIIIFLVIFFRFRKKMESKSIVLPPWDIALIEVKRLRAQLKEHQVTPVICVFRLSDIIRTYLEKRFSLHAPSQTSTEFLEELKREKSPLKPDDKDFLKEFMTASDLVKFAKLPADTAAIENAINKAENLVKTSKPEPVVSR